MHYPPDFTKELKERAGGSCECERSNCHQAARCAEKLIDEPGAGRWSPVRTGERMTFPPLAQEYIALCERCAVPRTGRPAVR